MKEYFKQKLNEKEYKKLKKISDSNVLGYIKEAIELCNPKSIFVNSGSHQDIEYIREKATTLGEELQLAKEKQTIHFDNYGDQARDKKNTKILVPKGKELQGVNTTDRDEGLMEVLGFLKNIMNNKEMIIGFYCLGPVNSPFSIPAVQITDSFYVAHSENILYRIGYEEFTSKEKLSYFIKLLHSAGALDERNTSKDLDKRRVYIDLEGNIVYSTNTQYAGNTVGLKKLSMRLAIYQASKEDWLCEHMLVMGIKGKNDRVTYMTGAFPSLCGKTSTAMMEGEYIVGDDIAYLRKINGEIKGVNVEKGIFGIIQGVNSKDDPLIWKALNSDNELIVSNILMKDDKGIHWIGKDGEIPKHGFNHSGEWEPGKKDATGKEIKVSHPNARFTIKLDMLDNLDPDWDNKDGLRISAFVYGGRDSDTSCPVEEAFDWGHGIITKGAALESETTAATLGKEGVRVINPMSNLDFVSVPLGKYLEMNLEFGKNLKSPTNIYGVNYFLKDENGKFFNGREDKRVWYKWIEKRVNNEVKTIDMPTGRIPLYKDLKELFKEVLKKDFSKEEYDKLFTIRIQENLKKIERVRSWYQKLNNIPEKLYQILEEQEKRLHDAQKKHGSSYISPFKLT
ncbi:MAG: phosphoenolpyruvate carboxykinase (GTP) [Endomicrobiales bacterium]|nr:phosphoenolpyruvate carboxykinase (GTP) [Endomicrobiales bacterium]